MERRVYGTSKRSAYTNNIAITEVAVCQSRLIPNVFISFGLSDCCLDVEWITADTFASCGADQRIFIMRVDEDEAIKVFK